MKASLYNLVKMHDNNYGSLEYDLSYKYGFNLLSEKRLGESKGKKTVSVITACYNQKDSLSIFLDSIANQTYTIKFPRKIEVIITDDGSDDGTERHFLSEISRYNFRILYIRQSNHREPHALNTSSLFAQGDLVFYTNPDVIHIPCSIEEHVLRHEYYKCFFTIGFRMHIMPEELSEMGKITIRNLLKKYTPTYRRDNKGGNYIERYFDEHVKKEKSVLSLSEYLKKYHGWNEFCGRNLPACIEANNLCFHRKYLKEVGGLDENMREWGYYDNFFGAKLIAFQHWKKRQPFVIPIVKSIGYHPWHTPRIYKSFIGKKEASNKNRQLYERYKSYKVERLIQPSLDRLRRNRDFRYIFERNDKLFIINYK